MSQRVGPIIAALPALVACQKTFTGRGRSGASVLKAEAGRLGALVGRFIVDENPKPSKNALG